jgi:hypothetical protein
MKVLLMTNFESIRSRAVEMTGSMLEFENSAKGCTLIVSNCDGKFVVHDGEVAEVNKLMTAIIYWMTNDKCPNLFSVHTYLDDYENHFLNKDKEFKKILEGAEKIQKELER